MTFPRRHRATISVLLLLFGCPLRRATAEPLVPVGPCIDAAAVISFSLVSEAFEKGDAKAIAQSHGVFARMLRGRDEEEFASMTNTPQTRRVVFYMAGEGLSQIAGKAPAEALDTLGYTRDYVRDLRAAGTKFKLVFFAGAPNVRPATWDNLIDAAANQYPEVASILRKNLQGLKAASFADIQREAPFDFRATFKKGANDPNFVTVERLEAGAQDLVSVRAFLYNVLGVTELYSGDGFTVKSDGSRGIPEYIGPNLYLGNLPHHKVLPMDP